MSLWTSVAFVYTKHSLPYVNFPVYSALAAWPCLCIADQDIPLYGICYSPTVLCSLTPPSSFQPERPRAFSCLVFLVFNSIATTTTTTTNKPEQHRAAVLLLLLLLTGVTWMNCFISTQESRLKYLCSVLKYPASTIPIWVYSSLFCVKKLQVPPKLAHCRHFMLKQKVLP